VESSCESGVDCIGVAQDRDRWRALVNAVMNLLVEEWCLLGCYAVWLL
jgi:hypothetical protein